MRWKTCFNSRIAEFCLRRHRFCEIFCPYEKWVANGSCSRQQVNGESESIHYAKLRSNGLRKVGTDVGITYTPTGRTTEEAMKRLEVLGGGAQFVQAAFISPCVCSS